MNDHYCEYILVGIQKSIDQMKSMGRLNVQEQIALKMNQILKEAKFWRLNGLPSPIKHFLRTKGIDVERSIFLNYEQDYPGISTDVGKVLTENGEFLNLRQI